jgi:CRISPR-associated protein Cas7/Cse4/CasC, subtype I-E/ECOLI
MFLQIHTLTSYHASLLNRDDAGLAKRIPFGDATRLRVSSQCLKRHWRGSLQQTIDLPDGIRSRHFFGRQILPRLVKAGVPEEAGKTLIKALTKTLITSKDKEEKKNDNSDLLMLKQPVLFGKPEADFLVSLLKECAREGDLKEAEKRLLERLKTDKANFKAMLRQAGHGDLYAGLEGALFGRFVTSDILSRSDACVHVAHAFTVHKLDTEVDFFTVVDDLNLKEETGAAHAGDMELGAGLFYGYVVVDVPLLISNLSGCDRTGWAEQDPADACDVLKGLITAIATVSPGAKLGATAPYAYADFVLLETGRQQPRSLANAYLKALPTHGDVMQAAVNALGAHLAALDSMYGLTSETRVASSIHAFNGVPVKPLGEAVNLALQGSFRGAR